MEKSNSEILIDYYQELIAIKKNITPRTSSFTIDILLLLTEVVMLCASKYLKS